MEEITLEELQGNLRDAFNMDSVEERMANQKEEPMPEPIDIYQRNADARAEEAKRVRPNGSSPVVKAVTQKIVSGDGGAGLAAFYRRARDDSDLLRRRGDITRADMVRQQYMDEHFIPAVEAVIGFSSPDELLNSTEALNALDELVLSTGSGKGYTASYVKSAYGNLLGQNLNGNYNRSDDTVINAVHRIKLLADIDEVRSAIGIAKQIKDKIDNGDNIASDEDYELISRVVSYGN